jgi:hypothetical protein
MIGWLSWLLSPIGRWFGGAAAAFAFLFAAYWKARSDGKDALRHEQIEESQRRTRNALEADARARDNISRGGLYENDGHRRD